MICSVCTGTLIQSDLFLDLHICSHCGVYYEAGILGPRPVSNDQLAERIEKEIAANDLLIDRARSRIQRLTAFARAL